MAENFRPIAALPVDRPIQEKFLKYLFAVVVAVLTSTVAVASTDGSFKPKAGFVPDALTATAIAEAVLSPIYGRNSIVKQKPYNVSLKDEVWTVEGTSWWHICRAYSIGQRRNPPCFTFEINGQKQLFASAL